MQDTLNKMVASVRYGVLGPDDASRSIHECAALLGLELATEIPVTTLIISGMRKTAGADDLIGAFQEFGEIAEAAVSSNQRGFGKLIYKLFCLFSPLSRILTVYTFDCRNSAFQDGQVRFPGLAEISNGRNCGPRCCCGGQSFETRKQAQ